MRYFANTATIRAGAQRFAAAGMEMRQNANRIDSSTAALTEPGGWTGKGSQAYQSASQLLSEDAKTSGEAFQNAARALNALASQLDQVNNLRQQAMQMENRIHSLQAEIMGADEYRREALRDQIASLRYRMHDLDRNADYIEDSANRIAGNAFEGIAAITNHLHFGHAASVSDKMSDFFGNLWNNAKDAVLEIGEEIEEAYDEVTEYFEEKLLEAQEGGILGGYVGFFEGFGKYVFNTLDALAKQTPNYMLTHPGETIERAKGIFKAVSHPQETADAVINEIKSIPYEVKLYWERDIENGTTYTRMKAAGTVAGVLVEAFATRGLGRLEKADKLINEGFELPKAIPNPEVGIQLQNRVDEIREALPRKIREKGNVGVAKIDIEGLPSELKAHSRINAPDDLGAEGFVLLKEEDEWIFQPKSVDPDNARLDTELAYTRKWDTEFKILEDVATRLGPNHDATGTINLFTERLACASCSDIIMEFRMRYPNIQVNVHVGDR